MDNKIAKFTIGTDPEFFIKKGEKYISAIPFIHGSKYEPLKLASGVTLQRDNVTLEVASVPAYSGPDFVEKVRACISEALKHTPEGHELVAEPSAIFEEDQLREEEANSFGCDPDFDAYRALMNEKPSCPDSGLRSCGAHIHVGCMNEKGKPIEGLQFLLDFDGKIAAVKAMDLFHGIVSTILDSSKASVKRRLLYGKAGTWRPTDYGIEYRVLSNYWMKAPELVMLMDLLTRDAMGLIRSGKLKPLLNKIGENIIKRIINTGNRKSARVIFDKYVKKYISENTADLFAICESKVCEYGSLKNEWKL